MNTDATGLIGVGLLGSALAERLLRGGFTVHGFDTSQAQRKTLAQCGGIACDSAADVVDSCNVLFLSLPSSDVVLSLVDQLRSRFKPRQVVIDTTTGDPTQMVAIGQSLSELGVHYVEATVAGSSAQARDGQVAIFVGGDVKVVKEVEPLLAAITLTHFHLGPIGSASRFKLVHNLVLGLHRAVLAEGLMFAESLGFDPGESLQILKQTPAASPVMETKGQRMVDRDYELQARLSQHLKDVRLILAEAERAGADTPLSKIHKVVLEQAVQLGFGDADNSAVMEAFRRQSGKSE
jgi:3-hydroxyisobutyrate dehydrogenase-like beta-hydroxyacid dehydrogenase